MKKMTTISTGMTVSPSTGGPRLLLPLPLPLPLLLRPREVNTIPNPRDKHQLTLFDIADVGDLCRDDEVAVNRQPEASPTLAAAPSPAPAPATGKHYP